MSKVLVRQFGVKDEWQSNTWEHNAFIKRSSDNLFLSIDWDTWPDSFQVTAPNTYIHEVASPNEDIYFPTLTMTKENFQSYKGYSSDYWSYSPPVIHGGTVPLMWQHPTKNFGFSASLTLVRQWPPYGWWDAGKTKKLAWSLQLGLWGCKGSRYYHAGCYSEIADISAASPIGEIPLKYEEGGLGGAVGIPNLVGPFTVIETP